jgi:UDP-N-acetylglucosamine 4-epimerase
VPLEGRGHIYNVGCGERTSLNKLFVVIRDELARLQPELASAEAVHLDFRPGDIRHSLADIARIRTDLGYQPTHLLADGIGETLGWYIEQLSAKPDRATA